MKYLYMYKKYTRRYRAKANSNPKSRRRPRSRTIKRGGKKR